jgi:PadR family transcriptional regulator PadR
VILYLWEVRVVEIRKEWLKGYIDLIILSLLINEDLYGYEMSKKMKEVSGDQFVLKDGTLYPALKRLEKKDLIEGYWSDSVAAARRKYYRITPAGIEEFKNSQKEWLVLKHILESFLEVDHGGKNRKILK